MTTARHYDYGLFVHGWVNGYSHEDAERHELGFELGDRVHLALEEEAWGWSALDDLAATNL